MKNLLVILRLLKEQFGDVHLEQSNKRFIVRVGNSIATIDHETKVIFVCAFEQTHSYWSSCVQHLSMKAVRTDDAVLQEQVKSCLRRIENALYPID